MRAWMLAVLSGAPKLITPPPFVASGPAIIPQGVSRLESVIGTGAPGKPASTGRRLIKYQQNMFSDTTIGISWGPRTIAETTDPYSGFAPADYTDPPIYYEWGYSQMHYTYVIDNYAVPATTGASVTGFGETFAGGVGGPATPREVKNVAVTPGSYQLVIPAGGSITISYYQ